MFNCLEGCYRIAFFWKFGKQIKQYTGRTNNNWSLENAVSHSLAEGTATRNTLFLAINSYCQATPNSNKHANQTHGSSRCELGLVLLLLLNPIFWESNTLSASVSPTVPRRVCHKFIKSMSKKISWCRRWTTQSKTTKRLQFYHFAIAMANVSSISLKTFFFANSKSPPFALCFTTTQWFVLMSDRLRQSVLLWHMSNSTQRAMANTKSQQTVLFEFGTWPKGRTTPSTNITCFQSRCQLFVRQIPSVHVRSMLGPAIRIPIGEICNGRFVWSWSHVHDIPTPRNCCMKHRKWFHMEYSTTLCHGPQFEEWICMLWDAVEIIVRRGNVNGMGLMGPVSAKKNAFIAYSWQ